MKHNSIHAKFFCIAKEIGSDRTGAGATISPLEQTFEGASNGLPFMGKLDALERIVLAVAESRPNQGESKRQQAAPLPIREPESLPAEAQPLTTK